MTMRRKRIFFLGCLMLLGAVAVGQEFSINQVELTGDHLKVHYDLIDTTKGRTYTVYVYSSRDNFLSPLTKLAGDAGLEVRPGSNKTIDWSIGQELGSSFEGDVELEVRGHVYVPFIRFNGFGSQASYKRGIPFIVKWSGGTRQNILNFQLYKDKKLVHTFSNVANASEYKVLLPTSVKPGDDYYFRVADAKNSDQVVISPTFKIKRKVALVWKIVPFVLVSAAIPFLLPKKGPEEIGGPPNEPGNPN